MTHRHARPMAEIRRREHLDLLVELLVFGVIVIAVVVAFPLFAPPDPTASSAARVAPRSTAAERAAGAWALPEHRGVNGPVGP